MFDVEGAVAQPLWLLPVALQRQRQGVYEVQYDKQKRRTILQAVRLCVVICHCGLLLHATTQGVVVYPVSDTATSMAGYQRQRTEKKEEHQHSEGTTHGIVGGVQWSWLVVRSAKCAKRI